MPRFFIMPVPQRYDVFVDLWDDRGAHHDGQAWASWWVFDGGDDMAHLQRMDAVGKLNDQVKKLEAEGGIEIGGTPKKLLCFKKWGWESHDVGFVWEMLELQSQV